MMPCPVDWDEYRAKISEVRELVGDVAELTSGRFADVLTAVGVKWEGVTVAEYLIRMGSWQEGGGPVTWAGNRQ